MALRCFFLPRRLSLAVCLAAAALAFLAPVTASAVPTTIRVVAVTGDPAPDGNGTLSAFSEPVLNDAGQVAFTARLTGTSGGETDNVGIFRSDGTALVEVARTGQPVTDGGTLSDFSPIALNDVGQVAFHALLSETSNMIGIYRGDGMTLDQVARLGQEWSDDTGSFRLVELNGLSPPISAINFLLNSEAPSLNNAGQTAFTAMVVPVPPGRPRSAPWVAGSNASRAVYISDGTSLVEIAGGAQTTLENVGAIRLHDVGPLALNNAGQVAFLATYNPADIDLPLAQHLGLLRADGETLVELVHSGQPAPDSNGTLTIDTDHSLPHLNDAGKIVFAAQIDPGRSLFPGEDPYRIFGADGAALLEIVRGSDHAPDGNGTFFRLRQSSYVLNGAGQVAFHTHLFGTAGGSADNSGIFRGDENGVIQIARRGELAPDGENSFVAFSHFLALPQPPFPPPLAISDAGQVAFGARLSEVDAEEASSGQGSQLFFNHGIFVFDDDLGVLQVARRGDALLDSTIVGAVFAGGQFGRERSGMNKSGAPQIAYHFFLADGRQGIAVWTLVPEVSTLALLCIALVTVELFALRRRWTTPVELPRS